MSAEELTLAEIQALPVGSVVEDVDGDCYKRIVPLPAEPVGVWQWIDPDSSPEDAIRAEWVLDYPPVKLVSTP